MQYLEINIDENDKHDDQLRQYAERIRLMPLYCKTHPDQKSVLILSNTSSKGIAHMESVCCQDFQNQLLEQKLISQ